MRFFYLLLIIPSFVFSQECSSSGCTSKITDLYTNTNGVIYIGTQGDETKANCIPVSGVYFTLTPSKSTNSKEVYSSMLAAFIADKKIQLRIKENTTNCELAYVRLSSRGS